MESAKAVVVARIRELQARSACAHRVGVVARSAPGAGLSAAEKES